MSFNDFMSMEEKLRKAAENEKSAKPTQGAGKESAVKKNAVGSDQS